MIYLALFAIVVAWYVVTWMVTSHIYADWLGWAFFIPWTAACVVLLIMIGLRAD